VFVSISFLFFFQISAPTECVNGTATDKQDKEASNVRPALSSELKSIPQLEVRVEREVVSSNLVSTNRKWSWTKWRIEWHGLDRVKKSNLLDFADNWHYTELCKSYNNIGWAQLNPNSCKCLSRYWHHG